MAAFRPSAPASGIIPGSHVVSLVSAPWPIVGHLPHFMASPIGFLSRRHATQGDVAGFRLGKLPFFLVNHPELIKDVLVTQGGNFTRGRALSRAKPVLGEGLLTSEGDFHKRQRRLVQPAFHRQRFAAYGETMAAEAARFAGHWRDGQTVAMDQEMAHLTLAVVGQTLFGADVGADAGDVHDALVDILDAARLIRLPIRLETLQKLPLPAIKRFTAARDRLDAIVYRLIAERRAGGEDRGDLLSMLLAAEDDEGDGAGMSDQQVRDEAMTLFLAGHETMANALTWVWYLLAQNPEAEGALHAELDSVLAGRAPSAADMPALPYTRAMLAESMRLYPPVWVIGRRAIAACTVGDTPIPAGAYVLLSQYLMHRDPRFWDDPTAFRPARWLETSAGDRPKYAYFPFGGGGRTCIGEHFAWMEGMLTVATLAQRWRPRLAPGHREGLSPMIVLRPKHGMPMVLEARRGG